MINLRNSGLDVMIDEDKIDDLARLYRLYSMVPKGIPCLRSALKDSIARRGYEINQSSLSLNNDDDPKGKGKAIPAAQMNLNLALKWVQDVLDLKDKFDGIWSKALQSDRDLESGLNEVRCFMTWSMLVSTSFIPGLWYFRQSQHAMFRVHIFVH